MSNVVPVVSRGNPTWQKGVSANPSGRPPVDENARLAKELALKNCPKAIQYFLDTMIDAGESTKNRLHAAGVILDRGLGKAAQSVEFVDSSTQNKLPSQMTTQELMLAKSDVINAKMDSIKKEFIQHWRDGKMEELAKSWGMG
jgi:hypothetical protein